MPQDELERKALKEKLIRDESEYYLEKDTRFPYSRIFTIYEGIFGSSAGIDESNGNGHFILLPRHADRAARDIREHLCNKFKIADCGVLIVDSRSAIMRNGTIGIALGHAGFCALTDYRGTKDIFGRELQFERMNVADCIASAATLTIGEGNECTPIAIFSGVPHVTFGEDTSSDPLLLPSTPMKGDVFAQFIVPHDWQEGKQGQYGDA